MSSKKIVILTPHPDDETLGAGGYLLKKKSEGYQLIWIILTHMNEKFGWSRQQIEKRNEEIEIVSKLYPFDFVYNLGLEPTGLDKYSISEIIKPILEILKEHEPEIILLPSAKDPHSDHKIANQVAISITKKFRNPNIRLLLEMEILSETNFGEMDSINPNYFIDITEFFDKKLEILKVYKGELGEHPFPRSIESVSALATLRGSQRGTKYAEAFKIIKFYD